MSRHHNLGPAYKKKKRAKLWTIQEGQCAHCGVALAEPDAGTLDHVVARSRRGGNGLRNLLLSCFPCNAERRNRPDLGARGEMMARRVAAYCGARGPGYGVSGAAHRDDVTGAERFAA